jgi:hypothetical protein
MTMSDLFNGGDSKFISANARSGNNHPSIREMGLCERQACDSDLVPSAVRSRLMDAHFQCTPVFQGTPLMSALSPNNRNAREELTSLCLPNSRPTTQLLRI